jgi:hypothetical protein
MDGCGQSNFASAGMCRRNRISAAFVAVAVFYLDLHGRRPNTTNTTNEGSR